MFKELESKPAALEFVAVVEVDGVLFVVVIVAVLLSIVVVTEEVVVLLVE